MYQSGATVDLLDDAGRLRPFRTMIVQAELMRPEAVEVVAELEAIPDTVPPVVRNVIRASTPVARAMRDAAKATTRASGRVKKFSALKKRTRDEVNRVRRRSNGVGDALRAANDAYPSLCSFTGGFND